MKTYSSIITLSLIKGDNARIKADAIINLTNEWLKHETGLSKKLIERGGE
jgi:O-acetyl-ADP-ribose deacetylase (regulator of RNase III)